MVSTVVAEVDTAVSVAGDHGPNLCGRVEIWGRNMRWAWPRNWWHTAWTWTSDVKLEGQFRLTVHRGRYENVADRIGKPDRHRQAVVVKT